MIRVAAHVAWVVLSQWAVIYLSFQDTLPQESPGPLLSSRAFVFFGTLFPMRLVLLRGQTSVWPAYLRTAQPDLVLRFVSSVSFSGATASLLAVFSRGTAGKPAVAPRYDVPADADLILM